MKSPSTIKYIENIEVQGNFSISCIHFKESMKNELNIYGQKTRRENVKDVKGGKNFEREQSKT